MIQHKAQIHKTDKDVAYTDTASLRLSIELQSRPRGLVISSRENRILKIKNIRVFEHIVIREALNARHPHPHPFPAEHPRGRNIGVSAWQIYEFAEEPGIQDSVSFAGAGPRLPQDDRSRD
jgi:hypothetical protein